MEATAIANTFSTPGDIAHIVNERAGSLIGVILPPEQQASWLDSLAELLAQSKRRVIRLARNETARNLEHRLADMWPTATTAEPVAALTSSEWRDRLLSELLEEQKRAQERITAAKERGESAELFDRDVAGWLATGLRDLLTDPITSAAFLAPGQGALARLATDDKARFAETDFLRPDGIRFLEASRPAQTMLTKLSLASTNQFRAAAARLFNSILDGLSAMPPMTSGVKEPFLPRLANRLIERGEEAILLLDEAAAFAALEWDPALIGGPIRIVVVAADEPSLRSSLPAAAEIWHLAQLELPAPIAPERPPELVAELERLERWHQESTGRAALFIERGLLSADVLPDAAAIEGDLQSLQALLEVSTVDRESFASAIAKIEAALGSLQQTVRLAWQEWFDGQLRMIDAEAVLHQLMLIEAGEAIVLESIAGHAEALESIHAAWDKEQAVAPPLPASTADVDLAKATIGEWQELDKRIKTQRWAREEEGMAFDAAVAAGGASLDLLTDAVIWWLKQENRDWSKYRIVPPP